MRAGTSNTGAGQAIVNQAPATPSPVTVEAAGVQKSNMQENLEQANGGYGSIMWFLLLGALYLFFDWFQTRDKIASALEPSNMRANAHNIVIVGMAAILFFNGANVICTKLASLKIPGISKAAAALLPLVQL